ncbi:MAG TPA: cupin domain-containing protein [Candidatus Dormibacteraeota bacterium]|nr:cupin domain-containing protein [Candidatus Dormibacteraeota bacterium]
MKRAERASPFESVNNIRPHQLGQGINARAIEAERMTIAVIDLDPGADLPEHHHENEQLGFVIAGSITMRIGTEQRELHPGDMYAIPSDVPHEALAGPEGCTVADVFAPPRADWRDMKRSDPVPGRWPERRS